jgi:hypothetical protein
MTLRYESGEEVRLGDHVTFAGRAARIELVVRGLTGDPLSDWEFEMNGPGALVVELHPANLFGRVYWRHPETKE